MSNQSDVPTSTEPSDHFIVPISPDLPNDDMGIYNWEHDYPWRDIADLPHPAAYFREHDYPWRDIADLPHPAAYFSEHDEDEDEDEDTPASQTGRLRLNRTVHLNRRVRSRISPFKMLAMLIDILRRSRRREVLNTPESQAGQNLAFMREVESWIHGAWRQVFLRDDHFVWRREVLNTPASQAGQNLAFMREHEHEHVWMNTEDSLLREHFRMNVDLPASQAYQRPPGDWYIVIGLISAISFAIYGILFDVTSQMYKEEDGSFFSHHGVMVTISMVSMIYAAFSGVFLCVIYYLATADPTNTYRKRMRFLSGTFVYAACFGPAVMFMAMFVRPLCLKVFAWTVLGAALTRVGLYIGG